jgi:hypothetical protein
MCQYWRPEAIVVGWPFTFVGLDVLDALVWLDVPGFSEVPHPDANPRIVRMIGSRNNFCVFKGSSLAESYPSYGYERRLITLRDGLQNQM